MGGKVKIAILGGGPAGLSAAYHLTQLEGFHSAYEVTVYQMGWRLGGKGASGRNLAHGGRIEEHGIHLFGSFYPNTWRMLRTCYEALYPGDWRPMMESQFLPNSVALTTLKVDGNWTQAISRFPSTDDQPWARLDEVDRLDLEAFKHILPKIWRWLRSWWDEVLAAEQVEDLSVDEALEDLRTAAEAAANSPALLDDADFSGYLSRVASTLDVLAGRAQGLLPRFSESTQMAAAIVRGSAADRVWNGLDSIDDLNHKQWLIERGGLNSSIADSPAVDGIPNICFQYPRGDVDGGSCMSAAAFLTFIFRALGAPGPFGSFFALGTGESVMLPVYDFLKSKGVRFEFFSRVVDVVPAGSSIKSVVVEKQATPLVGDYDPLVRLHEGGKPGWPSLGNRTWPVATPFDRLQPIAKGNADLESWYGERACVETVTLERGNQFDFVILALPIGVHSLACRGLVEDGRVDIRTGQTWLEMVKGLETIPTQALQIWLDRSPASLGLPTAKLNPADRLTGATWHDPLNGWADFSDLLGEEKWAEPRPKALLYFCGPLLDTEPDLSDPQFPDWQRDEVKAGVLSWLSEVRGLLPNAGTPFLDELHRCEGQSNPLNCQYIRANVQPNERYVLSKPGHLKFRRLAWHSGFDNMALAGDWIFHGLNISSFEGAVMSGALACHALTSEPPIETIYGYQYGRMADSRAHNPDSNVPMISGEES